MNSTMFSVLIVIAAIAVIARIIMSDRAINSIETGDSEPKNDDIPEYLKPRKGIIDQSAGFFKEMINEGKRAYKEQSSLYDNKDGNETGGE